MNRAVLFLLLVMVSGVMALEKHTVAAVYGFDKSRDYRLLNDTEMKALKAALTAESMVFTRAMNAAKKEWAKDESKKGKRFPMLSKRTVRVVRSFSDREEAMKKLKSYGPKDDGKKGKDAKPSPEEQRKALTKKAVGLLVAQMSSLSEGKATGMTPGMSATQTASAGGKKGAKDGGPSAAAKDFKFTFAGKIHYNVGLKNFTVVADAGVLVNGKPPWGLDIPMATAKKFGAKEDWDTKKVKVAGSAELADRGPQVKFQKVNAITSLSLVE